MWDSSIGGCSRGLCVSPNNFNSDTHFVIGQPNGIYCYNPEGRGQCYAFEGKKRLLHWFKGYLTVISEEEGEKASITVLDVQNKYIGFSAPIKPILSVVSEWGSIYLITQEGKIHQLIEKDTRSKIDLLLKKNFYDVAIKVAKNQNYKDEDLVNIFRQYGDYLYAKGDQVGAIDQYVRTIGVLEPSYVIQKFLDAPKIHNLTEYLQALHRKGLASEDHTTLLLNCYTKLKDGAKLDEFILSKEDKDIDFDVDIAINVCRQAGYTKHAVALAERHHNHDLFLKIVIENDAEYKKALTYISNLPTKEAEKQMKNYGSILVKHAPDEFTEVLKTLIVKLRDIQIDFKAEDYIHLFVNDQKAMVEFLEYLVSSGNHDHVSIYNTLLEYQLYALRATDDVAAKVKWEKKIMDLLKIDSDKYNIDQALVLCQLNNFNPGLLFLYQRSEMHEQILKHHFTIGDMEAGVNTCRRFGGQCPPLWVIALEHIAKSDTTNMPQHLFTEVLENIETYGLMSPLQVVSTLSTCPTATLGVVKDYLLRIFGAEERSMEDDRKVIEQYKAESEKLRDKLKRLNEEKFVFQSTKCSACNRELDIPSVHFLCGCSFHLQCFRSLSDSEDECPICASENKKILDMMSQERDQHEQFHAHLEKAEDGFSIVAEYLGRGLFEKKVAPEDQSESRNRLRSEQDRSSILSPMSIQSQMSQPQTLTEGRMRLTDRSASQPSPMMSEARMRATDRSVTMTQVPESRLRASEQSGVLGVSIPSESRMRLREQHANSLTANLTHSPTIMTKAVSLSPRIPRKEDIGQANPFQEGNPFGSPDSNDSLGDSNPFAAGQPSKARTTTSSQNPFGEDNYDDDKNPFAE